VGDLYTPDFTIVFDRKITSADVIDVMRHYGTWHMTVKKVGEDDELTPYDFPVCYDIRMDFKED